MFLQKPDKVTLDQLVVFAIGVVLIVILVPFHVVDAILVGGLFLVAAHIFLRERVLLLFLFVRPMVDFLRDIHVINLGTYTLNLNAAISVLFFLWAVYMIITHREKLQNVPEKHPFLILIGLMVVSLLFSFSQASTLEATLRFVNIFFFFLLSYTFISTKKITLSDLTTTIFVSAAIPVLLGIGQLIFGTGLDTMDVRGRIFGSLGHPNVFAFFLLSLLIIHSHVSGVRPVGPWRRGARTHYRDLIYVTLLILLIFTYTRITLVGLLIYLVILGVYRYRNLLYTVLVSVATFYLVFFPINDALSSYTGVSLGDIPIIARITERNEDADSVSWRLSVAEEAFTLIRLRPLLGYGYGSFETVWKAGRSELHQWDDSAEAHNEYLRITLELGLIGLAAFLYLLARLVLLTLRTADTAKRFEYLIHVLGWMSVFIVAAFSDNMLRHTPVMWLTFAYWGAVLADTRGRGFGVNLLRKKKLSINLP